MADPLIPLYEPRPYSADPGVVVPDIPADVPLYRLSPADAPSQSRPGDLDERGRPRLRFLTRGQFRICKALVETLIVPPDGADWTIPPAKAAINVDRYLAASRSPMRLQIRLALTLLEYWTLTSLRLPFSRMSLAGRRKWAARFERNKGFVVTKLLKLKNLVYLNYYGDPDVNAYTGYTFPHEHHPDTLPLRRYLREHVWAGADADGTGGATAGSA